MGHAATGYRVRLGKNFSTDARGSEMGNRSTEKQTVRCRWERVDGEQGFQTMTCPGADMDGCKGCKAEGPAG